MDDIKSRLRKILALTASDKEHERVAAEEMLIKLLDKHNLTMADISDETLIAFKFYFTSKLERQLILQLAALEDLTTEYRHPQGERHLIIEYTKVDGLNMQHRYNVYRAALKKHVSEIFEAFLYKNDLMVNTGKVGKLSMEEMSRLKRILAAADNMDATRIHKAIE